MNLFLTNVGNIVFQNTSSFCTGTLYGVSIFEKLLLYCRQQIRHDSFSIHCGSYPIPISSVNNKRAVQRFYFPAF